MAFSKKWAHIVSYLASRVLFYLILLQVPLFRLPCRGGVIETPLVVASYHLTATEVLPAVLVKILLWPGTLVYSVYSRKDLPSYDNLLKGYPCFNKLTAFDRTDALKRIEVLAGSYFLVAGAFLGFQRPGRMGLVGAVLILWGLNKEIFHGKRSKQVISIYPAMWIVAILAFLSIRSDVRQLLRCFRIKPLKKS